MNAGTLQSLALQLMVVSMMLAVGLKLTPAELVGVGRQRRALGLALVANLVVVPALCLAVARLIGAPPAVATGIVLVGSAPGGASGPLFVSVARADLPFAVALMVTLAVISVFTVPPTLSLLLAGAHVDAASLVWPMMRMLVVLQLVPLLAGMAVRRARPAFASRLADPVSKLANALLLAIIVALLVFKGSALLAVGATTVLACLGLVVASLGLGALVSPVPATRRAAALDTAVRNLSLALLITATWFPDPLTDATVLTFGLFVMAVPLLTAWAIPWRPSIAPGSA